MGGPQRPLSRAERRAADRRTIWASGTAQGSKKAQRAALAHSYAEQRHALPNARETYAAIQVLREIRLEEQQEALLRKQAETPAES